MQVAMRRQYSAAARPPLSCVREDKGRKVTGQEAIRGCVQTPADVGGVAVDRRELLIVACCAAVAMTAGSLTATAARASSSAGPPIVSFHRDEPWLDETGAAFPWLPPQGCRGGRAVENLSEERLRRLNCYL
jgi:hypothetical protein